MGKALYRKYRSRSLDEIVGQEHITATLRNALKSGRIAHAYLLTGPRGVGKTSIARILAHEVNGIPYSEESNLDIIEIDAASNNGVEDVRELRDKIPSAPVGAKYKVFIIDEVHMLSKAAFNALLKTLEEPPAHVIFILATTEAHKLPETIISRTQRYSFRPVPEQKVIDHLRTIATKEKITIDDDALALIAAHGGGSFRDSIGLLDQASSIKDHVAKSDIEQLLGRAPTALVAELAQTVVNHDMSGCVTNLTSLTAQGYEPAMVALQLGHYIREQLTEQGNAKKLLLSTSESLSLLRDLLDVPAARDPMALLEITLLKHATPVQDVVAASDQAMPSPEPQPKVAPVIEDIKPASSNAEATPEAEAEVVNTLPEPEPEPEPEPAEETPSNNEQTSMDESADITALWQNVLQTIKKTHNTLYGIARMAKPSLEGDTLTLELTFAFHQKRLNEPRNKAVLTQTVEQARGAKTVVNCVVVAKHSSSKAATNENIATISNIFGGAELLES